MAIFKRLQESPFVSPLYLLTLLSFHTLAVFTCFYLFSTSGPAVEKVKFVRREDLDQFIDKDNQETGSVIICYLLLFAISILFVLSLSLSLWIFESLLWRMRFKYYGITCTNFLFNKKNIQMKDDCCLSWRPGVGEMSGNTSGSPNFRISWLRYSRPGSRSTPPTGWSSSTWAAATTRRRRRRRGWAASGQRLTWRTCPLNELSTR